MDTGSRIKLNYQTRLFFLIIAFTWILTCAFFALQYAREKEYKVDTINNELQMTNIKILHNIESHNYHIDRQFIEDVSTLDSLRVTIIDFKGNVLFDNVFSGKMENHIERPEVADAINKGAGYTIRRVSETNNNEYFYSATRGDSILVRSAVGYSKKLSDYFQVDSVYMWVIVVIAIIVSIVAYFVTCRLGQNIQNLSDFASQAERGNILSYDTSSFPQDELGDISRQIISLYQKLQQTTQERDNNRRDALFEEQEKVRIKQQLTSNINHEIKTPVHAIQACLETVINNRDSFNKATVLSLVDKAYQNVCRLSSLLRDISVITRITEAGDQIKKRDVCIDDVIRVVIGDIAQFPPEKRMRVNLNLPDDSMVVKGNETLIEAIFHNLLINALTYSGGRDIFIDMYKETPEYYMFRFADNGIGVPEEHIGHLFERFYRVDEGRSRKLGGTGLGLAIVKNAILFHHGSVTVKNRPQGGLEFEFSIHK